MLEFIRLTAVDLRLTTVDFSSDNCQTKETHLSDE